MASKTLTVIPTEQERNRLVEKYSYLVKQTVNAVHPRFPSNVEKDDLFSYGIFGLIDAIHKYDPSKGVKFETYATSRIYGAMIDELRRYDWVPRSVRAKQKKVDIATARLQTRQDEVTLETLSEETGLSEERLLKLRQEMHRAGLQSLDETLRGGQEDGETTLGALVADSEAKDPTEQLHLSQRSRMLKAGLAILTDNERTILEAIYFEEVSLRVISRRLKLSISRISQLHRRALGKLENHFEPHLALMVG